MSVNTSPIFDTGLIPSSTTPNEDTYPLDETLSCVLNKPENVPLHDLEEKVLTALFRRKLFQAKKETGVPVVKLKTRGQPIGVKCVTLPRKDKIKTPTKRKKRKLITDFRSVVAGKSFESSDTLLASELKHLPCKRKNEIAENAGVAEESNGDPNCEGNSWIGLPGE